MRVGRLNSSASFYTSLSEGFMIYKEYNSESLLSSSKWSLIWEGFGEGWALSHEDDLEAVKYDTDEFTIYWIMFILSGNYASSLCILNFPVNYYSYSANMKLLYHWAMNQTLTTRFPSKSAKIRQFPLTLTLSTRF